MLNNLNIYIITLVFIIHVQVFSFALKYYSDSINFSHQCNVDDNDFWAAYSWHFKNITEVTTIKIYSKYSQNNVEDFFTNIMSSYYANKKITFEIIRHEIWYPSVSRFSKYHCLFICMQEKISTNYTEYDRIQKNSLQEQVLHERMRSFSADLNYAFHIICWDIEDFTQLMKKNSMLVFPNPRGIYLVTFLSSVYTTQELLYRLFKDIWENYGVLNILLHMPCSCNKQDLYMYKPFDRAGDKWGTIICFNMTDVKKYTNLFRNTLKSLNGYPLKIGLFKRLPTVMEVPKLLQSNRLYKNLSISFGYCGLDAMLLATLAQQMSFTPVVVSTSNEYGFANNGSFYGIFGDVVYRKVDISFNSRFVDGLGDDLVEYLTPVINDKFCLILPKALRIPEWMSIFRCFDIRTWLFILFSFIICSVYWHIVHYVIQNIKKKYSIISFLEMFALFISVPVHFINTKKHRIFLFTCLIFNIIIVGSFQGQLITSFSTQNYYADINTLEDFAKTEMNIIATSQSSGYVFGDDGSKLSEELKKKIIVTNRSGLIRDIANGHIIGTLERMEDAKLRIILYDGENKAHICQECPKSYYFTYIVPIGSPYIHVFNIVITMFREAGLVMKWSNDVNDALIIEKRAEKDNELYISQKFTLGNLQILFYILIFGWILSGIIFIIEMYV